MSNLGEDLKKILSMQMQKTAEHQTPSMECKLFELRDKGTFIPMMAVRIEITSRSGSYLLRRAGWGAGDHAVYFMDLEGRHGCQYNRFEWRNPRTFGVSHDFIIRNWDDLRSGDVIDVEFILEETEEGKVSEQHTSGFSV